MPVDKVAARGSVVDEVVARVLVETGLQERETLLAVDVATLHQRVNR